MVNDRFNPFEPRPLAKVEASMDSKQKLDIYNKNIDIVNQNFSELRENMDRIQAIFVNKADI